MNIKNNQKRKAAILIGTSLIIMTLAAAVSYGVLHNSLIDMADEQSSVGNLSNSLALFNIEILGWFIIIVTDLSVSWGVWLYFKNESKNLALSSAILRLVYTLFLTVSVFMLIKVSLNIASGNTDNLLSLVSNFENTWSLGLIIFGVHLVLLGMAACYETKVWGFLLVIAGVSYFLIHSINNFLPGLAEFNKILEKILILPMTVGETGFGIWLLVKGGRTRKAVS